jgi:hypothetical protein
LLLGEAVHIAVATYTEKEALHRNRTHTNNNRWFCEFLSSFRSSFAKKMEPNRRRGHSFIDDDETQDMSVAENSGISGDGPEPLDPTMTFDDEEINKDHEDFDESNEEEYFSRGRSRSRSVHENDDKVKILSDQEIKAQVAKSKEHPTERLKVEKTGPLQGREVAILQQVLSLLCLCG